MTDIKYGLEKSQYSESLVSPRAGEGSFPGDYEFGIVVGSEFDLEQKSPWTFRRIHKDKTHPAYEKRSYIKIGSTENNGL